MSRSKDKNLKTKEFDKYYYYHASVQAPETDVEFFKETFEKIQGRPPITLREDFCGTFANCCAWVQLDPKFKAIGIDLDPEPIAYGEENYRSQLSEEQSDRISIYHKSVLDSGLPKADMIVALNFSYYLFKKRSELRTYFKSVFDGLDENGVFMVDCFGGSLCQQSNEDETEHDDFSYFWDQDSFDPVTNEALFYIHFKRPGEKKRKKVFTYDWRMWTIPEIRELMEEAGFQTTRVYWEGTTDDGEGDGNFVPVTQGEECEAWISYIAATKN